jgi:hypothetical protein
MDDYVEPDWNDPDSLRACAARLKLAAALTAIEAGKYARFAARHDPGSVRDLMPDYVPEDPAVAEERERDIRTARAKQEILDALAAEERQVQQQQSNARQQFRQTPIGRLFR